MKNITFALACAFLISCNSKGKESKDINQQPSATQTVELKQGNFIKTFTGKINNKLEVVFHLENTNGKITGYYFYQKSGIDIQLAGELTGDDLTVFELDHNGEKVAKIQGKLVNNKFDGKWNDLKSTKSLTVKLVVTDKKIPALPKDLAGTYANADGTSCSFNLTISKLNGSYLYSIKTAERQLNGSIIFYRSLDEQTNYIIFKGIKWSENEGALNDEGEPVNENQELPDEVEGVLSENEINIQNTGNAMNSYTKFYDCGDKFITLKK